MPRERTSLEAPRDLAPRLAEAAATMLTSSMEQRDVVKSCQPGVNSYIVKQMDFDRFVTAAGELGLHWLGLNRPPAGRA